MFVMQMLLCLLVLLHSVVAIDLFPKLDITLPAATGLQCRQHTSLLRQGLQNQSLWAMRMQDASPQDNLAQLYGNMYQLGQWDECMRQGKLFPVRYCLPRIKAIITEETSQLSETWRFIHESQIRSRIDRTALFTAICVPSSCSLEDLRQALQVQVEQFNNTQGIIYDVHVDDLLCSTEEDRLPVTPGEITFWLFCTCLLIMVALGTCLHNNHKSDLKLIRFARCFSLQTNTHMLFHVPDEDTKNPLSVLHGVKAASIVMVLYGHKVGIPLGMGVLNYQEVEEILLTAHSMFVPQADMVVDTFFFISGVLATFIMYHVMNRNKNFNPFQALLARISRLAPTYYFIVWFEACAAYRLGSGPLWKLMQGTEAKLCSEYWWANIFFINNYLPVQNICMVHSWFLPCDIHFFLMLILLIWLLVRFPRGGLIILAVIGIVSALIPPLVVHLYSVDPLIMFYDEFLSNPRSSEVFDSLYGKSHVRATAYLIGVAVGYFLYAKKSSKFCLNKVQSVLLVVVGLCLLLAPMMIGGLYYRPPAPSAVFTTLYVTLRRPSWTFGVATLLLVHRFSHKNIVSQMLSSKPAIVLSKLTLGVYLIHFSLIQAEVATKRTSIRFTLVDAFIGGAGELLTSTLYAGVLYLILELPCKRIFREVIFAKSIRNLTEEVTDRSSKPHEVFTIKL